MRNKVLSYCLLIISFNLCYITAFAQSKKIYSIKVPELSFQISNIEKANQNGEIDSYNGLHASYLFNLPYTLHLDFNRYFGIMPNIHLRHIGLTTKDESIDSCSYDKVKRCVYTAGTSFGLKFGNLDKGRWIFGGIGIDWSILYRQKKYEDDKNHRMTKEHDWFSKATDTWIPSVFAGIQFKNGINLKGTYYYQNILNKSYNGSLGDFSTFKKSQIFDVSITIVILPQKLRTYIENNIKPIETTEI